MLMNKKRWSEEWRDVTFHHLFYAAELVRTAKRHESSSVGHEAGAEAVHGVKVNTVHLHNRSLR